MSTIIFLPTIKEIKPHCRCCPLPPGHSLTLLRPPSDHMLSVAVQAQLLPSHQAAHACRVNSSALDKLPLTSPIMVQNSDKCIWANELKTVECYSACFQCYTHTTPQGSFIKCQDDHTHTRCWRNCIGCRWSSASPTSWPCWRSRYGIRQHRHISVGTSEHAVALGHCGHQAFCFSLCRSDELISANDPLAAQRLQLGTLCLLLSSTVTLSLYLNLG